MTDKQFQSLPAYARQELLNLRRQVVHLKGLITQGSEGSRAFANPYGEAPAPLGKDPHIAFFLNPEDVDGWVDRLTLKLDRPRHDGPECLEVMSGRNLFVQPRSSNVVELYTRPPSDL